MKKQKKSVKKYGLGSTIGTVLGASVGTLIAPGIGTGIGATLGGGVGNLFDNNTQSINENKMTLMKQMPITHTDLSLLGNNQNIFAFGGEMLNPNAEIEGGEVAISPNGQGLSTDGQDLSRISSRSFKSNGSKHSNGGHEVNLPEGTMIASDQILNPLTGKTFAKDIEKQERAKGLMEKRFKYRPNDKYIKDSAKRSGEKSEHLFNMQETMKENLMLKQTMNYMAKGGLIKYDNGGFQIPFLNTQEPSPFISYGGYKNQYDYNYNVDPNIPKGSLNNIETNNNVMDINHNENYDFKSLNKYTPLIPGAIGTTMQMIDSYKKDPVTRIRNSYGTQAIQNINTAIDNQNNLRYDVNDQLGTIANTEAATNRFIDSNVSGGGSRLASRLSNRGVSLNSRNQVFGDRNRTEAGFKQVANNMLLSKANLLQSLGTEDANYENLYRENILQRDANLRKNRYSAFSNMSSIGQQFGRDQELMKLLPLMFPNAKLS